MTKQELEHILKEMNLPVMRCDLKSESNIRWLLRNIHIRNGDNDLTAMVVKELKSLLQSNKSGTIL